MSEEEKKVLVDIVWPTVEEANKECSVYARVAKSRILVADQPLLRAGKGTVQQKPTLKLF